MANKIGSIEAVKITNSDNKPAFFKKESETGNSSILNANNSIGTLNQTIKNQLNSVKIADTQAVSKDFWVKKSGDAKKLGDELLTKHFNFDDEDLKAFKEKYGDFIISDKGKCNVATSKGKACTMATFDDILGKLQKNGTRKGGWKTEDGNVKISLPAEQVKALQNFRWERIIDKAVNNISDTDLRNQVRSDLLEISSGNSQNRISAANRLMYLEKGSESDLSVVRQATLTIANQPENKENPMTNLVASKIKLDEAIKKEDLKGVSDAEWQMKKAVKLVQGQDALTGEYKKDAKVNRAEAAWINRQVAQNLRSMGQNEKADQREMLARFYEVDDKERKSVFGYPLGEINRWQKTDTPSMRPISQAENDWQEYQERFSQEPKIKKDLGENKFKFEYKVPKFLGEKSILEVGQINKDNKISLTNVPLEREKLAGSLRVTGTATFNEYVYRDRKGRVVNPNQGQSYQYRNSITVSRTTQSVEMNQSGINNGIKAGRGVDLINQFNKWTPIVVDVWTGRSRVAERDNLEKSNKLATKYPVPPKPEDLPKERERLIRLFGNDQKAKVQVNEIMQDLEVKSHAFWNR